MDERVQVIVGFRSGKTRDNCTPNQKRLRLRTASPCRYAFESIWDEPQPEHKLSICAPSRVALRASKRKRTECSLQHTASDSRVPVRQVFLEPLEVQRSRPRAIEVHSLTTLAIS